MDIILQLEKNLLPNDSKELFNDDFLANLLEKIKNILKAKGCVLCQNIDGEKIIKTKGEFTLGKDTVLIGENSEYGILAIAEPNHEKLNEDIKKYLNEYVSNILKLKKIIASSKELLYIDSLTDVYNSNALIDRISNIDAFENVGVLFVDINNLGYFNNNYGHDYGDEMLKTVARCISSYFRKTDVYRKGGDEFVVICDNILENEFINRIKKIKEKVAETEYSASFGYVYSPHTDNISKLITTADKQMYKEKEQYKQMFPKMNKKM